MCCYLFCLFVVYLFARLLCVVGVVLSFGDVFVSLFVCACKKEKEQQHKSVLVIWLVYLFYLFSFILFSSLLSSLCV